MLGFLRRLRRSLIEEGNLRKYLVYAIGEIFLVVVGILLALQINNLNEAQKARTQEFQHLRALKEEFILNLTELNATDSLALTHRTAAKKLAIPAGPNASMNEAEFTELFHVAFKDHSQYSSSSAVLEDLLSSGSLSRITRDDLREKLASWPAKLSKLKEAENEAIEVAKNLLRIIRRDGSFEKPDCSHFAWLGFTSFRIPS